MERTKEITIEKHGPDIVRQGSGTGRLSEEAIALLALRPLAEVIHLDMLRWMRSNRLERRLGSLDIRDIRSWRRTDLLSGKINNRTEDTP